MAAAHLSSIWSGLEKTPSILLQGSVAVVFGDPTTYVHVISRRCRLEPEERETTAESIRSAMSPQVTSLLVAGHRCRVYFIPPNFYPAG